MKFKTGDRVRIVKIEDIKRYYGGYVLGDVGTIVLMNSSNMDYIVKFDRLEETYPEIANWFVPEAWLELDNRLVKYE